VKGKQWIVLAGAVAVAAAAAWYSVRPQARLASPRPGHPAPEIALTELATGSSLRLPLAGQPYALEFFSYT